MGLGLLALAAAGVWLGAQALRDRRVLTERRLALQERELALQERRAEGIEEMPPLPADLQMRVNAETELWARDQVRALVQQLWNKHKQWDAVRAEMSNADAAAVMQTFGWSQTSVLS